MTELNSPLKLLNNFKDGKLSKAEITDHLVSLLERSDNALIRAEALEILNEIGRKDVSLFKIVENYLISDANPNVRCSAANLIINKFPKEGINPLKWTIHYDASPMVLTYIFNSIESIELPEKEDLLREKSNWLKKFASDIGIVETEAKFILDLEVIFAQDNLEYEINANTPKFYEIISDIKIGEPWFEIIDNHIVGLNYNYFNWRYIKDNMDVVGSLSNLKYKDLFFITIRNYSSHSNKVIYIPESIGTLKHLEHLTLSRNNIKTLPKSISSLKSLRWLDISYNNISEIPETIKNLENLQGLDLSKNSILLFPKSLKFFFGSIENFKC